MIRTPSRPQVVLARLVVALSIAALFVGLLIYGISAEVLTRIWHNMLDRPGGPFVFRFVLQPIMATAAALRDGLHDARTGRLKRAEDVMLSAPDFRDPYPKTNPATGPIKVVGAEPGETPATASLSVAPALVNFVIVGWSRAFDSKPKAARSTTHLPGATPPSARGGRRKPKRSFTTTRWCWR